MSTSSATRFGKLLRRIRKRVGVNQMQLGDSLGVSTSSVSKWETGASTPPQDPQLYDRLRTVPGFSDTDITLLLEALEVDESAGVVSKRRAVIEEDEVVLDDLIDIVQKLIEEQAKAHRKITTVLEKNLKIRAGEGNWDNPANARIKVRRAGILGKRNQRNLARAEAAKANRDQATLLAQQIADMAKYAALSKQYILDVVEFMPTIENKLPEELKPLEQTLTQFLTDTLAETLTQWSAAGLAESAWAPTQATPATLPAVIEAEEPSAECLPDTHDDGIIAPAMPHEVVEHGDHPTEHISDLQSQATLGSERRERPTHYPHENVVFHVVQLQTEALSQQGTKKGSTQSYEVVADLKLAAAKIGVPAEEIMTIRDIQTEWGVDRTHLQDWSRRGKQGQPHLPPLPVRLKGPGGGQLLFLREEVERKITNPPKTGRPPK